MSEQTREELESAQRRLNLAQTLADHAKRDALATAAAQMPDKAQAAAKKYAKAQPDVTRRLGTDGVASLRADVAQYAEELGAFLLANEQAIEWPKPPTEWIPVASYHVHSAISKVLRSKMGAFNDLVESKGYRRPQVSPQALHDSTNLEAVAQALTDVFEAQIAVRKAKKADNDSTVDDLWGD